MTTESKPLSAPWRRPRSLLDIHISWYGGRRSRGPGEQFGTGRCWSSGGRLATGGRHRGSAQAVVWPRTQEATASDLSEGSVPYIGGEQVRLSGHWTRPSRCADLRPADSLFPSCCRVQSYRISCRCG